jgi:hypothetical protein
MLRAAGGQPEPVGCSVRVSSLGTASGSAEAARGRRETPVRVRPGLPPSPFSFPRRLAIGRNSLRRVREQGAFRSHFPALMSPGGRRVGHSAAPRRAGKQADRLSTQPVSSDGERGSPAPSAVSVDESACRMRTPRRSIRVRPVRRVHQGGCPRGGRGQGADGRARRTQTQRTGTIRGAVRAQRFPSQVTRCGSQHPFRGWRAAGGSG